MSAARFLCRAASFAVVVSLGPVGIEAQSRERVVSWGERVVDSQLRDGSYTAVAAGVGHTLALKQDGSLVAWGYNYYGQCFVPDPPVGQRYVQIDAGDHHNVALRSDGNVVAWGWNTGDSVTYFRLRQAFGTRVSRVVSGTRSRA